MFTTQVHIHDRKRNTKTLINKYSKTFQTLKQARSYANTLSKTYGNKQAFEFKTVITVVNNATNKVVYKPTLLNKLLFLFS